MNTLKNKIENYLSKYCVFIFAIVTLFIILLHVPYWDETHAFYISRLKLSEIFAITRVEGHTMLWYLILKPFSSLKLYPYSMSIINWLFCVSAIFVLWKKAPFSTISKTFITFSVPFLFYWGSIARCYSIGILFLFLICSFWQERFKRPYLFSSLIILAANTSVLAMIGSFFIGLVYIFEMFKKLDKKQIIISISIFLFGAFLIVAQFYGVETGKKTQYAYIIWQMMRRFLIFPLGNNILAFLLHSACFIGFYYYFYLAFKKSKKALFLMLSLFSALTFLFFKIYSGNYWNHYFYYIYFIIVFWMFHKELLSNKFSKILFNVILFLMMFPLAVLETNRMDITHTSSAKNVARQIIENDEYKKAKLYTLEWWSDLAPGALMYLMKEDIYIYDLHNRKRTSFESIKDIFRMEHEIIDFDEFYKNMDKNSYLLTKGGLLNQKFKRMVADLLTTGDYVFETPKKRYLLKLIEENKKTGMNVYKVSEI